MNDKPTFPYRRSRQIVSTPAKKDDTHAVIFLRVDPEFKQRLVKLCDKANAKSLNQFLIGIIEDAIQ